MNKIKLSAIASIAIATFGFVGCGGGSGSSVSNVTYTGTVDLAPIKNMLVYTGKWDGNSSNLPSNYTYTDENGSYSLSAPTGSTIIIEPVAYTKVGNYFFVDNDFKATTTDTKAIVTMSDAKRLALPKNYTEAQLLSLYGVISQDDIVIKDVNTSDANDAKKVAYKEIRDSQDFALKVLFKSYLTSKNALNDGNQSELDKNLDKYILSAWLDESKDKNITLNDKDTIENIATKIINNYNEESDSDISASNVKDELKKYSAMICTNIATPDLINETNTTLKINEARSLYSGVVGSLGHVIKKIGTLIDSNISASQNNQTLAPTLMSLYVGNYLEEGK